MVGKNVKLYDMVLQFLRTLFLRTRNVHYCTLRAELLMSLHDLDVGDICTVDPCHKVAPLVCPCTSSWVSLSFSWDAVVQEGLAPDYCHFSFWTASYVLALSTSRG
jgi:hypothetical protein